MAKKPEDVRGVQIHCPNYIQCPICYGCRNHSIGDYQCMNCELNPSNICDLKKHNTDLINKFYSKREKLNL